MVPFSQEKIDALMDQAGIDLVLVNSKENIQYLLGGYKSDFYKQRDAFGVSRYLACLGYPKGRPEHAFYVGNPLERSQQEVERPWVPNVANTCWHSGETGKEAAVFIRKLGLGAGTLGVEKSFMPADCFSALQEELPGARMLDAHYLLDQLRAIKRPDELAMLREASEKIVESMVAVVQSQPPGRSTRQIAHNIMQAEIGRGLEFEYCLTCVGPSFNRASSETRWEKGAPLSLDSGGNKHGYIGDLARMAVMGKPTALMKDLLAEIMCVQEAARGQIRPGATGSQIIAAAHAAQARCPHGEQMIFNVHGMGLVQHEAPFLTMTGAIPYPGLDAKYTKLPIAEAMVLSVETDLLNPEVGFMKLEDTVAVTEGGYEAYGDGSRDWIVVD